MARCAGPHIEAEATIHERPSMSEDNNDIPSGARRAKKSETLEVRMPYETKRDFMTACREDGSNASDTVRDWVDVYLDERARNAQAEERPHTMFPNYIRRKPWVAAGAGAIIAGLIGVAAPSFAEGGMRAAFDALDANHDGVITMAEFAREGAGRKSDTVVVVRRHSGDAPKSAEAAPKPKSDAKPGEPQIQEDAVAYWLGDDAKGGAPQRIEMRREIRITRTVDDKGDKGDKGAKAEKGGHVVTIDKDIASVGDLRAREFERFDADKDGKISFAEFADRQRAMLTRGFERLDVNHDGSLSPEEFAAMPLGGGVAVEIKGGPNGDGDRSIDIPSVHVDKATLQARFAELDRNHDGKLDLIEYLPPT